MRILRADPVAANRAVGKSSQGNWLFRKPELRVQTHYAEVASDCGTVERAISRLREGLESEQTEMEFRWSGGNSAA
jgi:hypothetical protein